MPIFVERSYTDGLLETRRYRLRCFGENLAAAAVAPAAVVLFGVAWGGGAIVAGLFGGLGLLLALSVAFTVRTLRAAAIAGVCSGAFMLALMLLEHRLFTHPILSD